MKGRYLIFLLLLLPLGLLALRRPAACSSDVPAAEPFDFNSTITNDLSSLPALDNVVDSFMRFWTLKGVSLAVTRGDSLLYARGYGKADLTSAMTPGTTMRLASVSKLLTAVGIMRLQEQGKLHLDTPVFGPYGILEEYDSFIRDHNYYSITVEHLLRHQGGFAYRGGDVMFHTLTFMRDHSLAEPPTSRQLIEKELRKPLAFAPGSWQQYSNFGYLLLSEVIEKVSGMPYDQFMQQEVFEPCGCHGFFIAGNYLSDRRPGESMYFMHPESEPIPSYEGRYSSVEPCYGGNDITSLKGAGAWAGSAVELARVVSCIDGFGCEDDILTEDTVRQMTTFYDKDTFALGWVDCTQEGEWTRTGSFSGTSALVKVFPDGECWVLVSNTSAWRGAKFTRNTTHLVRNLRRRFSSQLPQRNLYN